VTLRVLKPDFGSQKLEGSRQIGAQKFKHKGKIEEQPRKAS
jgi:hypothetical protein